MSKGNNNKPSESQSSSTLKNLFNRSAQQPEERKQSSSRGSPHSRTVRMIRSFNIMIKMKHTTAATVFPHTAQIHRPMTVSSR